MRVTVVPAQVTTVEDRIAGKLGMSQIVLLFIPVIFGSLLYVVLPPGMQSAPYKLFVLVSLLSVCGILAVRIKGTIVLFWLVTLLRYQLRPRYYVFDKRSVYGREQYRGAAAMPTEGPVEVSEPVRRVPALSFEELIRLRGLVDDPAAKLAFEMRKGGLYVRVTEVKQEG